MQAGRSHDRQYVAASHAADATKIMSFIQKDEAVSSAGLGVIHRGWTAIHTATDDAIKQNVRVKITVGTMDVTRVANDTALAVAKMSVSTNQPVKTASGELTSAPGAMTLVVKRQPDGLRIIHEHYSLQTL
jgi:ketosteroid isomerase-like protein